LDHIILSSFPLDQIFAEVIKQPTELRLCGGEGEGEEEVEEVEPPKYTPEIKQAKEETLD